MNQAKPLISVLTPIWNRAYYLCNVFNGLKAQTLRELAKERTFPITLMSASMRIGKGENGLVA